METPTYEYGLTKADYIAANRLFRRRRKAASWSFWLIYYILPIFGAVDLLLLGLAKSIQNEALLYWTGAFKFASLWFLIFCPASLWWAYHKGWRNALPSSLRDKPVTLQFDQQLIISAIPGRSEGRYYWTSVLDFVENNRIALIFVTERMFLFIPKAALPEQAWKELRTFAPEQRRKLN